jgi:hypothetical protein
MDVEDNLMHRNGHEVLDLLRLQIVVVSRGPQMVQHIREDDILDTYVSSVEKLDHATCIHCADGTLSDSVAKSFHTKLTDDRQATMSLSHVRKCIEGRLD